MQYRESVHSHFGSARKNHIFVDRSTVLKLLHTVTGVKTKIMLYI